jgi:Predicted metal-dependent phosphoesterases (PHP family)
MAINLDSSKSSSLKPEAQNISALKQVFQTIDADSCPGSYNFHMHTVYSDGRLQPEALMEQAIARGLKGLAITDHHSTQGYVQAQDGRLQPEALMEQAIARGLKGLAITDHHSTQGYVKAQLWLDNWKLNHPDKNSEAPSLWTGAEINAELLNNEVHILAYAFSPQHPSLQPYLRGKGTEGTAYYPAARVIEAIHEAGGLKLFMKQEV